MGLDFDYLSPIKPSAGRIELSDAIADVEWNELVMYPAGYFSRDIPVDTTLKLPAGWKYATALETASDKGDTTKFKRTSLNTLVESPLYAGLYYQRVDLSPASTDIVRLNLCRYGGRSPIDAGGTDEHKKLVAEADDSMVRITTTTTTFCSCSATRSEESDWSTISRARTACPANYFTDWYNSES